jgi:hypothetical protein
MNLSPIPEQHAVSVVMGVGLTGKIFRFSAPLLHHNFTRSSLRRNTAGETFLAGTRAARRSDDFQVFNAEV